MLEAKKRDGDNVNVIEVDELTLNDNCQLITINIIH